MKPSKLIVSILLIALLSGCGWMETDSPAATPATPDVQDTQDEPADEGEPADKTQSEDTPSANNSAPEPVTTPEEPAVEEGRYFYSEPAADRCDDSTQRCSMSAAGLAPAVAAQLDFMNIPNPVADCEEPEEYAGSGDGIACAFDRLGPAVSERIDAEHFATSFVFELYQDSDQWKLDVFKTDASGKVVPSSLIPNTARSLYGFDSVTVTDGNVVAEGGEVLIRTDYWGFPVEMAVRNARLEGTAMQQGDALVLQSAEITGHFEVLDLFANLNQQASSCADDVSEPFTNDSSTFAECPDFGRHADASCRRFDLFCPLFSPFAILADVDLNSDELADAFSVRLDVEFQPGQRRF